MEQVAQDSGNLSVPEQFKDVAEVFEIYPTVQAVYLFSTQEEAPPEAERCLTLAVVPRQGLTPPEILALRQDVLTDLADRGVTAADIDVLEFDNVVRAYEAVRLNRLIYWATSFDPGAYTAAIVRRYLDILPQLDAQRAILNERLSDDERARALGRAALRSDVIQQGLDTCDGCLTFLHRQQRYTYPEFAADPERYGSVERFLQLALDSLTGLGSYVIAAQALDTINSPEDIPAILAEHHLLDRKLKSRWVSLMHFRTALVHDVNLDRRVVYQVLHHLLDDLAALRGVFAALG